jgi:hypothetical protein
MKQWLVLALLPLLVYQCNNNSNLSFDGKASGCKGFASLNNATSFVYSRDSADYCSAEKIRWKYNSINKELEILHTRNIQNCGAKWEVSAEIIDNQVELIEKNVANGGSECLCNFDSYVVVKIAETIPTQLLIFN